MGNDFDTTSNGFVDFLLLDESGFPLVVLEAKAVPQSSSFSCAPAMHGACCF